MVLLRGDVMVLLRGVVAIVVGGGIVVIVYGLGVAHELRMAPALEALVCDKVPLALLLEPVVKRASLVLL